VVFGHIHEAAGHEVIDGINFVNASTCNFRYKPVQQATIVDIPCTPENKVVAEEDELTAELNAKLGF
jgi:Icc-related predicted phosphoesterase